MDFKDQRLNYQQGLLIEERVLQDPYEEFDRWMQNAVAQNVKEPYAMALATAGNDGQPHVRTMLMRTLNALEGLTFYSNYLSLKGLNLSQNPKAEVLFFWTQLEQQIRVGGGTTPMDSARSEDYFWVRPRDSQVGAWVSSPQSGVIANRNDLDQRFTHFQQQFEHEQKVPKPEYWGGYHLWPEYFEFWQGRPNRLHDRLRYVKQIDGSWKIERLMP